MDASSERSDDQVQAKSEIRVGTREVRGNLTHYLKLAREGTIVIVTSRNTVLAEITPSPRCPTATQAWGAEGANLDGGRFRYVAGRYLGQLRVGRALKLLIDTNIEVERAIEHAGFERLSITADHLAVLKSLPAHHRDPFDHILIAQSISEEAVLMTADRALRAYPIALFE